MNLPRLLLSATCVLLIACKGDKQSSADDDKMREEAKELARNLILVDMHIYLPYRLRIKNLAGKISLPMGMESGPIGDDLENVKYIFESGIRYITLTHGKDNQICDSSYDTLSTWKGLSPFGEKVV